MTTYDHRGYSVEFPVRMAAVLMLAAVPMLLAWCMLEQPAYGWSGTSCGGGYVSWASGSFTFRVDSDDFPVLSPAYAAINAVYGQWDGSCSPICGTDFDITKGANTSGSTHSDDSISSITLESLASGVLGHTDRYWSSCLYTNTDVQLDADANGHGWQYSGPAEHETAEPYSFRQVLLHELGHAAGLSHVATSPDIMNALYPFGGTIGSNAAIHEDAREGLRSLYADTGDGTDLGNSSFFWEEGDSRANRAPRSSDLSCDQRTQALPGGTVYRRYCLHNLGTTTETVTTRWYLSTDATITTGDTLIGSFTPTSGPNTPYCPCRTLTIPSSASSGSGYYIGSIVDPTDAISETNENNNVAVDGESFTVL